MNRPNFRLPPLFTFFDLFIIIGVGVLGLAFYGYRLQRRYHSDLLPLEAVVRVGEKTVSHIGLSRDTVFTVTGKLGEVKIMVNSGSIRFKDAPCPMKICEKMGSIGRRGAVLVCAPNQVMVRIEGGSFSGQGDGLDALSR